MWPFTVVLLIQRRDVVVVWIVNNGCVVFCFHGRLDGIAREHEKRVVGKLRVKVQLCNDWLGVEHWVSPDRHICVEALNGCLIHFMGGISAESCCCQDSMVTMLLWNVKYAFLSILWLQDLRSFCASFPVENWRRQLIEHSWLAWDDWIQLFADTGWEIFMRAAWVDSFEQWYVSPVVPEMMLWESWGGDTEVRDCGWHVRNRCEPSMWQMWNCCWEFCPRSGMFLCRRLQAAVHVLVWAKNMGLRTSNPYRCCAVPWCALGVGRLTMFIWTSDRTRSISTGFWCGTQIWGQLSIIHVSYTKHQRLVWIFWLGMQFFVAMLCK